MKTNLLYRRIHAYKLDLRGLTPLLPGRLLPLLESLLDGGRHGQVRLPY